MPMPPSRSVIHRNTWDNMGSCSAKRQRKLHLQTRNGGGGYGMSTMDIGCLAQSSCSWVASAYIRYTGDKYVMLTVCSTSGHATRTTPAQGWATPSPLGPYFKNLNWEGPRTATRPIPQSSPPSGSPGQSTSSGPNVGAIAGGAVGGVVALVALITIVTVCLRRRKRSAAAPHHQVELETTAKSELDGQQKHGTRYTTSEGGVPSMTSAPAYSAQASPSYGTNSWSGLQQYYQDSPPHQDGDWSQQPSFSHRQVYYPPPSDTSQPPQHESSAELPEIRSPVNAELSNVQSPTHAELPDVKSPMPLRVGRDI
jgi:hypothetical protein